MLFLLGCLAILQITTLPGLLVLKLIAFEGTKLQRGIYTFALSLLISYGIVFLLTLARIYYQPVLLSIIFAEIIAAIWLYRSGLQTHVAQAAKDAWNSFAHQGNEFLKIQENTTSPQETSLFLRSAFMGFFVISLALIWSMIRVFWSNIGTIFSAWDAINSWNRWATSWASNLLPDDTHYYPQMIPTNWSVIYVAMGNLDIQFFAKAIMPIFAILLLVAMLELGLSQRKTGFFIALVFLHLLLKKFMGPEITNGYVDVAITFFAFLPFHALLHASQASSERNRNQLLILGALFAAGASVTKQGGVYIFIIYPIVAYISAFKPMNNRLFGPEFRKFIEVFALTAFIPLSWYIAKAITIYLGSDVAEVDEILRVSSLAYNNVGYAQQLLAALSRFDLYLVLFLFILVTIPFTKPIYRWLSLLVVFPYPILWAIFVGYDMRNLSIFVPLFALTGLGSVSRSFSNLLSEILSGSSGKECNSMFFGYYSSSSCYPAAPFFHQSFLRKNKNNWQPKTLIPQSIN